METQLRNCLYHIGYRISVGHCVLKDVFILVCINKYLPTCVVFDRSRGRGQNPWDGNCRRPWAAMWVLRTEPGYFAQSSKCSYTTEPSFQPLRSIFLTADCCGKDQATVSSASPGLYREAHWIWASRSKLVNSFLWTASRMASALSSCLGFDDKLAL